MAAPTTNQIADALLARYPKSFAEELGIDVERNTPSQLFRLLCMSLLFSARISADIARRAAGALTAEGWTTAQSMADADWQRRTDVLNESGYARFDERTSTMLGETAEMALEDYRGDLRELRRAAERDPGRERTLLRRFKGIGDVGVDIFFREVQVAWEEVAPFADARALDAAEALGLGDDAASLAQLVKGADLPRLTAALVRVELEDARDEIVAAARDADAGS